MVHFGFISLDILIILVSLVLLVILCIKSDKRYLASLILSIYPTILIYKNFPFAQFNEQFSSVVALIVIYILIFFVLKKNISIKKNYGAGHLKNIFDGVILSVSYVILLLSIYVNSLPSLKIIYSFSNEVLDVITKIPYGLALIIPIVALLITHKNSFD